VMPTNLYGPNDNFDLEKSHVLPALLRKIYLGRCLEENNRDAVRNDLNKRPVEGIDGNESSDKILAVLAKYGIKTEPGSPANTSVGIWGTGAPLREFLWSEEMADACVFIMENIDFKDVKSKSHGEIRNTHINIGTGTEISIRELAEKIKETVGFKGSLSFDVSKPDGTMRKLTDVSKLHDLGWRHSIEIEDGIKKLLKWYLQ